jgi:hypothetical protein
MGARGNLVGIKTRLGNTPQHGVLFGMTGAGKLVIVADLLAHIGHRFGFRLIVEEGLSHAVVTQTQRCEPIIVNPNGNIQERKTRTRLFRGKLSKDQVWRVMRKHRLSLVRRQSWCVSIDPEFSRKAADLVGSI